MNLYISMIFENPFDRNPCGREIILNSGKFNKVIINATILTEKSYLNLVKKLEKISNIEFKTITT